MMHLCPFLNDLCNDRNCRLWVKDEEMCSFRLLADDVADHRRRIRACGMETGEESFKKQEKKNGISQFKKHSIVFRFHNNRDRCFSCRSVAGKKNRKGKMKVREFLRTARKHNPLLEFRSSPYHNLGHIIECRSLSKIDRHLGWIYVANVNKKGTVLYSTQRQEKP